MLTGAEGVNVDEFGTADEILSEAENPHEALDGVTGNDGLDSPVEQDVEADGQEQVEAEVADEAAEVDTEEVAESEEETAELSEAEKKALGSKAQRRIKSLIDERNNLSSQVEQFKAETSRQMAAQQKYFQEQLELQRRQAEDTKKLLEERLRYDRDRAEAEQYEKLPLSERIKVDAQRSSKTEFERILAERDAKHAEQLQSLRGELQQRFQNEDRYRRLSQLNAETDESINSVLLNGVDAAQFTADEKTILGEMFMGFAGVRGKYPKESAPMFRKVLDKWAAGRMKALGAANKQRVQSGKNLPPVTPARGAKSPAGAGQSVGVKNALPKGFKYKDADSIFDQFAKDAMRRP